MRSIPLVLSFLAAQLPAGVALAEPFKCPRTGGNLTFGQEANVNSLDQHASNTSGGPEPCTA